MIKIPEKERNFGSRSLLKFLIPDGRYDDDHNDLHVPAEAKRDGPATVE